jgi:hypothetical protein
VASILPAMGDDKPWDITFLRQETSVWWKSRGACVAGVVIGMISCQQITSSGSIPFSI